MWVLFINDRLELHFDDLDRARAAYDALVSLAESGVVPFRCIDLDSLQENLFYWRADGQPDLELEALKSEEEE